MDIKGKKILFLGDSITEGWGASPDKNYVSLFKSAYPDARILNYGIGGTRIARRAVAYEPTIYDTDFCARAEVMERGADLVVVFGGTNDYGHGDAALGSLGDTDVYTFYGALDTLYSLLSEKYPSAKILILTPLHRLGGSEKNSLGNTLADYVSAIKNTAERYSFSVLDLFTECSLNPDAAGGDNRVPDGLHPNDEGHRLLFEIIDNAIKSL